MMHPSPCSWRLGLQPSLRKQEPSHCQIDACLHCLHPLLPPWAQAPDLSFCLLSPTINLFTIMAGGDSSYPPGLTPPLIWGPVSLFLFTKQLLRKCLHQLSILPYLLFALQPIPTWLPFPQLNRNGFCQVTSTLSAARFAEHISVFTSLGLSEAFNPLGRSPLLERLFSWAP